MQVIIAEKPSVAKNIADALNVRKRQDGYFEGDKYLITWAFGHLLELYDAKDYDEKMTKWQMSNFPFIPDKFEYKIKSSMKNKNKTDSGAKKQLNTIKKLIYRKDVDSVISACDYDREGQIIADIILDYLKVIKPVYRLLLNEWTPDEVKNGLKNLKLNSELKPVSDAGISRQWADWVIGINLTSVATLQYNNNRKGVLNIGRVIMPTLKIIYDRDEEIENFVSKNFFKLNGKFVTQKGETYEGVYLEKNSDRFDDRSKLKKIIDKAEKNDAVVTKVDTVRKKEYAPYLFNLSSLQGYITSKYSGWTSDKVLKVAQSLYEKKHITYPRTASIALEESLAGRAERVLNALKKGLPYENEIKFSKLSRVFNNKKIEGHSAIIPTYMIPNRLTKDESILYEEIKDRFIMQFMPVSEYDETTIETKINNKEIKGIFRTKGKIIKVEGWKKVQGGTTKDIILPNITKNEIVNIEKLSISAHKTKPPAHHTEKTLLRVMETAGKGYNEVGEKDEEIMEAILSGFSIGTPATRADTIKKLKTAGYVESKGKSLICSELGKSLVDTFPAKELFDLEYTGKLEKTLSDIEKGIVSKDEFLDFIYKFTEESVNKIKNDKKGVLFMSEHFEHEQEHEVLGLCPECGAGVIESPKAYGCSDWKGGCKFAIWKNDRYLASMKKKPNKKMVRELLTNGKAYVNGLVSKKGNVFDAILSYEKNPETGYYNWHMEFPERD